jgi:hypothetical protein
MTQNRDANGVYSELPISSFALFVVQGYNPRRHVLSAISQYPIVWSLSFALAKETVSMSSLIPSPRNRGTALTLAAFVALGLAAVRPVAAQTTAFTSSSATVAGTGRTNGLLNIGPQFTVNGLGITISSFGVFDYQSNGLGASHTVTLFSDVGNTHTALGSITVPSGGSTTSTGFQFATLAAPIALLPGTYSLIAYGLDGTDGNTDPYGELNTSTLNGSANLTLTGTTFYAFTTNTSPTWPSSGSLVGFSTNAYLPSASFVYTNTVAAPEPSQEAALGIGVLGLAGLALRAWKRRSA